MLLRCLRRNGDASYYTLRRPLLPSTNSAAYQATSISNSPWSVSAECVALVAPTVHSTLWRQILIQNRDFYLPPPAFDAPVMGHLWNITMTFGVEKLNGVATRRWKLFENDYDDDWLTVWLSGNALASIKVVALRQTRLVPGWVTVCGRVNHLGV